MKEANKGEENSPVTQSTHYVNNFCEDKADGKHLNE